MSQKKKLGHLYFCDAFGKSEPIFIIFFSTKFRKDLRRKLKLNDHLPSNLLPRYLAKCKWLNIQLYSTVNSVQSDLKKFYSCTVNILEDAISLSTQIIIPLVFEIHGLRHML